MLIIELRFINGNVKIKLPFEDLFEPNLNLTFVNIDKKNKTVYISVENSDGAGAYVALWIIENGKFSQQLIQRPF